MRMDFRQGPATKLCIRGTQSLSNWFNTNFGNTVQHTTKTRTYKAQNNNSSKEKSTKQKSEHNNEAEHKRVSRGHQEGHG